MATRGQQNRITAAAALRGEDGYVVFCASLDAADVRLMEVLKKRLKTARRSHLLRRALHELDALTAPPPEVSGG